MARNAADKFIRNLGRGLDQLLDVLASRYLVPIKNVYDSFPHLIQWFQGDIIRFPDGSYVKRISPDLLLAVFNRSLSSHRQDAILYVWDNNIYLRDIIKLKIGYFESKALLEKVLSSSTSGKSTFIDDYLSYVYDDKLLQELLTGIEIEILTRGSKISEYMLNKMVNLRLRLHELSVSNNVRDKIVNDNKTHTVSSLDANQKITSEYWGEFKIRRGIGCNGNDDISAASLCKPIVTIERLENPHIIEESKKGYHHFQKKSFNVEPDENPINLTLGEDAPEMDLEKQNRTFTPEAMKAYKDIIGQEGFIGEKNNGNEKTQAKCKDTSNGDETRVNNIFHRFF